MTESHNTVKPYTAEGSKKEQVAQMFNSIAHRYDFLNHFFSMGIDVLWRKKAIRLLKKDNPKTILDIATGTGDFAFEALKLNPDKVVGIDISSGMIAVGNQKVNKRKVNAKVELKLGDSENLEFSDNSFDAITVGFGVRNFENLEKGLSEMSRVLKPGGQAAILEFSKPRKFPIKQLYYFYFKSLMPLIGKIVSKDASAYTYLPESVMAFPEGETMRQIILKTGYSACTIHPLTGGIASIYLARK
jgi:demethylmenaquinone methyltransferase / 2-methoxy-6-polyprenyl-1,4-benzoquinol methylase